MSLNVPQDILQRLQDKSIINFDDHGSVFFYQTIKNLRFQSDIPVLYIYSSKIFIYHTVILQYIFILPRYSIFILPRYSIFTQDILHLFKIFYQDSFGTDEDYIPRF